MQSDHDDEVPEDRKLAEQGNTDAKLFVAADSEEQDESQEDAPEDAEASGDDGPEGGEAA